MTKKYATVVRGWHYKREFDCVLRLGSSSSSARKETAVELCSTWTDERVRPYTAFAAGWIHEMGTPLINFPRHS
jgi:hypothetical protein